MQEVQSTQSDMRVDNVRVFSLSYYHCSLAKYNYCHFELTYFQGWTWQIVIAHFIILHYNKWMNLQTSNTPSYCCYSQLKIKISLATITEQSIFYQSEYCEHVEA